MDFWGRTKGLIRAQNTTQEWVAGKAGIDPGKFRPWAIWSLLRLYVGEISVEDYRALVAEAESA